MDPSTHCPDCFEPPAPDPVCGRCGFDPRRVPHDPSLLPPFTPLAGERYLTGRVLGKPGGFGVVYAGVQTGAVAVAVAIKEFFPANQSQPLARRGASGVEPVPGRERDYAQWKARFVKEADVLSRLSHRRIVKLHDFFDERGTAYLVMERLHGSTLADWLGGQSDRDPSKLRRALPPGDAWALLMAALEALEALHARGIVHRDLNPNNLFLEGDRPDGVKLLDFGLASRVESGNPLLTSIGVGAPPYMAPEQAQPGPDDEITAAADCYSLAASLYCALTGSAPRSASERRAGFSVSDLSRLPGLDPALGRILMECLVLDWRRRPKDAMDVRRRLEARTVIPESGSESDSAPPQSTRAEGDPKLEPESPAPRRRAAPLLALILTLAFAALLTAFGWWVYSRYLVTASAHVNNSTAAEAAERNRLIAALEGRFQNHLSRGALTIGQEGHALDDLQQALALIPSGVQATWNGTQRGREGIDYDGRARIAAVYRKLAATTSDPAKARQLIDKAAAVSTPRSSNAPNRFGKTLAFMILAALTALAVGAVRWLWLMKFSPLPPWRPGKNAPRGRENRESAGKSGAAPGRFVKLGIDGAPLPDNARVWYCVQDRTTGLIWEIKTKDGGLRDKDRTYTWYDPNPKTNCGNASTRDGGQRGGSTRCDTAGYVKAVNGVGLCGWHDWRLPTREELRTIVDYGHYPAIDTDWFPNTPSSWYWSASAGDFGSAFAWGLHFGHGGEGLGDWTSAGQVRLVRAGQWVRRWQAKLSAMVRLVRTGH